MTPQEFKAWFDGFTEAFTGVPTKAQWARVKERVGEIDGKPVTERVFVDRYYPAYPPRYWGPTWTYLSAAGPNNGVGVINAPTTYSAANALGNAQGQSGVASYAAAVGRNFNSANAMADLGRADAQALDS